MLAALARTLATAGTCVAMSTGTSVARRRGTARLVLTVTGALACALATVRACITMTAGTFFTASCEPTRFGLTVTRTLAAIGTGRAIVSGRSACLHDACTLAVARSLAAGPIAAVATLTQRCARRGRVIATTITALATAKGRTLAIGRTLARAVARTLAATMATTAAFAPIAATALAPAAATFAGLFADEACVIAAVVARDHLTGEPLDVAQ